MFNVSVGYAPKSPFPLGVNSAPPFDGAACFFKTCVVSFIADFVDIPDKLTLTSEGAGMAGTGRVHMVFNIQPRMHIPQSRHTQT